MSTWRIEGVIRSERGGIQTGKISLDAAHWDGMARTVARFEVNLNACLPGYVVDWQELIEIATIRPVNTYLLEMVQKYRDEFIHEPQTTDTDAKP
jgi:hypothetical protein